MNVDGNIYVVTNVPVREIVFVQNLHLQSAQIHREGESPA